jgi:hypothetical protein
VMFFVAADMNTPAEAKHFCGEMENCRYITAHEQDRAYFKSSSLLGWQTDSRRNYALLEAMRWGAEIIVSVDDDMGIGAPFDETNNFFTDFLEFFITPFSGLQLGSPNHWFDHGQYTVPPARARGLPYDVYFVADPSFLAAAEVGAAQGVILGVPDTDACTAIVAHPFVDSMTNILQNGFVVHPQCKAVFNSQLTAFRAELAPAFAQFYFVQGRNTDIFASLLMRRLMREKNLYTYYGPPYGFHARQPRPLLKDLQAERYGVDNIAAYADYLNRASLPSDISVVESCRVLAKGWNGPELEAALAFYDDCESVL